MMCAVLFDTEPTCRKAAWMGGCGVCVSPDTICLPEFYIPACQGVKFLIKGEMEMSPQ